MNGDGRILILRFDWLFDVNTVNVHEGDYKLKHKKCIGHG